LHKCYGVVGRIEEGRSNKEEGRRKREEGRGKRELKF
jgi:hypothetical protein